MCGVINQRSKALAAAIVAALTGLSCFAGQTQSQSSQTTTEQQSKFNVSALKYEGCKPGQSKIVTATVTVTDQNGRSDTRSTKITVNCDPPYQRFPDLIYAKNDASINACSRNILMDQVAAGANAGNNTVILIGHRAAEESDTLGKLGPQLDQMRALNAAAVLIRCAKVPVSAIRIDSAGLSKTPVPTSVSCPEFVAANSESDWYARVEVYLVPKGSKFLPENAKHLASLPPELPENAGCPSSATR